MHTQCACCVHACGSRSASRFSLDAERCHVRLLTGGGVRGTLVKALADWKWDQFPSGGRWSFSVSHAVYHEPV